MNNNDNIIQFPSLNLMGDEELNEEVKKDLIKHLAPSMIESGCEGAEVLLDLILSYNPKHVVMSLGFLSKEQLLAIKYVVDKVYGRTK